MSDNKYESHSKHNCIDAYEDVKDPENWSKCPKCNLKPKVWSFDNGRHTACGCWKNEYDHFTISAESIGSVLKRTSGFTEYDDEGLKKNWNHFCKTGEITFLRGKREDGKW